MVKDSNHVTQRLRWGQPLKRVIKESARAEDGCSEDGPSDSDVALQSWYTQLQRARKRYSKARRRGRWRSPGIRSRQTVIPGESTTNNKQEKQKQKQKQDTGDMGNVALDFIPGSALLYGTACALQSAHGKFIHVAPGSLECRLVDGDVAPRLDGEQPARRFVPPGTATKFRFVKADDPDEKNQVCYGDAVWLHVSENLYLGAGIRAVGGSDKSGPRSELPVNTSGQGRSEVVPIIQHQLTARSLNLSRWIVAHPELGFAESVKGRAVGHLDNVRLEVEWSRLGTRMDIDGNVTIAMQPAGRAAQLAKSVCRIASDIPAAAAPSSSEPTQVKKPRRKRSAKKGSMPAPGDRGSKWTLHIMEIAPEVSGAGSGNGVAVADASQNTLLHAQRRLMRSKSRRSQRGQHWPLGMRRKIAQVEGQSTAECITAGRIRRQSIEPIMLMRYETAEREGWDIKRRGQSRYQSAAPRLGGQSHKKTAAECEGAVVAAMRSEAGEAGEADEPEPEQSDGVCSRVERARAVAQAAALEARIKSSVWAQVQHQADQILQEERNQLMRAATVLQRQVRRWINLRWQRRFVRADQKITQRIHAEVAEAAAKAREEADAKQNDLAVSFIDVNQLRGRRRPSSAQPFMRLVPPRRLRWQMVASDSAPDLQLQGAGSQGELSRASDAKPTGQAARVPATNGSDEGAGGNAVTNRPEKTTQSTVRNDEERQPLQLGESLWASTLDREPPTTQGRSVDSVGSDADAGETNARRHLQSLRLLPPGMYEASDGYEETQVRNRMRRKFRAAMSASAPRLHGQSLGSMAGRPTSAPMQRRGRAGNGRFYDKMVDPTKKRGPVRRKRRPASASKTLRSSKPWMTYAANSIKENRRILDKLSMRRSSKMANMHAKRERFADGLRNRIHSARDRLRSEQAWRN